MPVQHGEIEKLLGLTRDPNGLIRHWALGSIRRFWSLPEARAAITAAVSSALADEHPLVRQQALEMVRELQLRGLEDRIAPLLGDPDPSIRLLAAKVLGDCDTLLLCLNSQNLSRQKEAAMELGRLGCLKAVPVLRDMVTNDSLSQTARIAAAEALASFPSPVGMETLTQILRASRWGGRCIVLYGLANAASPLSARQVFDILKDALRDRSIRVRETAISALGSLGGRFPELSSEIFGALERLPRRFALVCLGAMEHLSGDPPPGIVEELLDMLHDGDPAIRSRAAHALGRMGPPEVAPHLVRLLLSPQEVDRRWGGIALEDLFQRFPQAVSTALTVLWGQESAALSALDSLSQLVHQAPMVLVLVRKGLVHPDPSIRTRAVKALGQAGELPDGMESDLAALATLDPDPEVRRAAIPAMVRHISGKDQLVAALLSMVKWGADSQVPMEIARAVSRFWIGRRPPSEIFLLMEELLRSSSTQVVLAGIEALSALNLTQIPDRVLEQLLALAGDNDPWVQMAAIQALGRCPVSDRTTAVIHAALQSPRQDVRIAAVRALALQQGGQEAT